MNKLLKDFETFRNSLIASIFDYAQRTENQTIFLESNEDYMVLENGCVIKQIYEKIFIKDDEVYVKYKFGEGFEPFEYEVVEEPLLYFSANEIYEMIMRI